MNLSPMLLTETWDKNVLNDTTKWYQIKENGVRAIIHIKDGKIVGIRNRSNNMILYCFPELKNAVFPYSTAILDAEICVFKNGKSVFYGGVDRRRSAPSQSVLKEYSATIVVFDAIHINGETLIMKPYKYRYEKLSGINTSQYVRVAENYYNGKELWDKVVKENLEGVVIKSPEGGYLIGKRSTQQIKLKNYKKADVVIEKVEPNEKGVKIFGKTMIEGHIINVESQLAGILHAQEGETKSIKYLDIYNGKLIQPTVINQNI